MVHMCMYACVFIACICVPVGVCMGECVDANVFALSSKQLYTMLADSSTGIFSWWLGLKSATTHNKHEGNVINFLCHVLLHTWPMAPSDVEP